MKKCTKCGEVKDLDSYHTDRSKKDNKNCSCKECVREHQARNKNHKLTCQMFGCNEVFKSCDKTRKYCSSCQEKLTKENALRGMKKCTKCSQVKKTENFTNESRNKGGKSTQCKKCVSQARKKAEHTLKCQNQDCCKEFTSHDKRKKYCSGCDPIAQRQKLAKENKKKCSRCNEIKDFSEFYDRRDRKNSKMPKCISCARKISKEKKYKLICQTPKCNQDFIANSSNAKYCPDCRPEKISQEGVAEGNKRCRKCKNEKRLDEFNTCKFSTDSKTTMCKACAKQERTKTKTCEKSGCGNVFNTSSNKKYCPYCHLSPKLILHSDDEIKEIMQKYSSRSEFREKDKKIYSQTRKKDWYSEYAQELWGDPLDPGGWSRSSFIEKCEKNNNGKGILYLIKCWKDNEMFYKIGITSRSIRERYGHNGRKPSKSFPYFYEIIWNLKGCGGQIWDMENWSKKETKDIRYQPEIWPTKISRETFKCHGNCKILRKPELIPPQKT